MTCQAGAYSGPGSDLGAVAPLDAMRMPAPLMERDIGKSNLHGFSSLLTAPPEIDGYDPNKPRTTCEPERAASAGCVKRTSGPDSAKMGMTMDYTPWHPVQDPPNLVRTSPFDFERLLSHIDPGPAEESETFVRLIYEHRRADVPSGNNGKTGR